MSLPERLRRRLPDPLRLLPYTHDLRGIHQVRHRVFGYHAFLGQQEGVIEHTVAAGDSLVLTPTGGGKSLCYQIPAIMHEGADVAVSPQIASCGTKWRGCATRASAPVRDAIQRG